MTGSIPLSNKRRSLIFVNIIITCISLTMLSTALSTALPAIILDLQIDVTTGQWLTSGYSLAMAITMPLTAFLITRFPTKKLYIGALLISLFGLLVCAFATTFPIMMLSRVLQAIGNGILTSMAQVILLTIYPVEKRGSIMGWYGLSISAAPVIAPTLAGIIVDKLNWQAIFYIVSAIIIISLVWAFFVFEDILPTTIKKFDIPSFALSFLVFGGITLSIGNIGIYSFFSPQVLILLLVGLVAGCLFVYRQLHIEEPFLELRTFKSKNFSLSVISSMILYMILMASTMIIPIYVQSILGKSATLSGLLVLPGSLVMAILSPMIGKVYDKIGIKFLFIVGSSVLLISNLGMVFITMETSIWLVSFYNVLRCIAVGCLMMPLVTWGTGSIPQELISHGSALITSLRTVSGAIGMALFVGVLTSIGTSSVAEYGSNALIHGLNVSFVWMSLVSLVLLMIGLFFVSNAKQRDSFN